jgi:hypothetical protein
VGGGAGSPTFRPTSARVAKEIRRGTRVSTLSSEYAALDAEFDAVRILRSD